jgi:hypothetical protein
MMASLSTLNQNFSTTSGSHSTSAVPSLGSLIFLVLADSGAAPTTPPTDNNADGLGTYSLVTTCVGNAGADTLRTYVRDALIGVSASTVFQSAPGATTGGGLAVLQIEGIPRSSLGAIVQSAVQTNQASGGTPTPTLANVPLLSSVIISAILNGSNPAQTLPHPGYTAVMFDGWSIPTAGVRAIGINSGETSAALPWGGNSASAFCSMIAEIDATQRMGAQCQ